MENLIFEQRGSLGLLQINRPAVRNALNGELLQELKGFLTQLVKRRQTRILVITGAGEKAFIAGADISEMRDMTPVQAASFCRNGQAVTRLLETSPLVSIAAINGYALGGGLEIALACDFIYAAKKARLGLPEVSLGLIPGFGGTQRLTRAVGLRLAKELIATGKSLTAEEAYQVGLVNKVCDDESLILDCEATAAIMSKNSFLAIIKAKRAMNEGSQLPLDQGLALEESLFAACFTESDGKEGIAAFLEKRAAAFK